MGDDLLRLIFIACHPLLSREAQMALTLKLLGGLSTAAIAACHARAARAADTDWQRIAMLYDALAAQAPSPVVALNRAVAVGMAHGPAAALPLVNALLADPALQRYPWLPSVHGDLLAKLGRTAEARQAFECAAALTDNARERALLLDRAQALRPEG